MFVAALGAHGLHVIGAPAGYNCDVCNQDVTEGAPLHGSRECDFDVCETCHEQSFADK